ncbi:hypothetical protein IID24_05320 [Patescibacteria group bacterium]|nr:hypothetical protein [Patescibacteria group bacterium]
MSLRKIHTETFGARVVKVYIDSTWGEFRCRLYVGGVLRAEADYFTGDKDDALATAKAMVRLIPSKKESRR